MNTRPLRRRMLALLASLAMAAGVFAQAPAPASAPATPAPAPAAGKITRLVIAFPPGGPVDFVARTIGEQLGRELGHQVIVDNKAGANGAIAADFVARALPDGQTLWLSSVGAVAINPPLYEKLPYDPVKDFAPVSLVVNNVELLVVNPANPANSGAEFIANSRNQPKGASMASSGIGSVPHLAMELLADATQARLLHVPYKGAAPAITDVVAGHVDGFFGDIPGLISFIKAGKLKPIGIAAAKRHPLLPDVKTFTEMGIAAVDSDNWYAIFASSKVPAAEIERISQALRRTLTNEAVASRLLASGAEPAPSTPRELAELLKNDTAKWSRVIRAKNIKPE
jgi:tripartite-type tricarboxylate transporter receptor subunit TctC